MSARAIRGYLIASAAGAAIGAGVSLWATQALPKMMTRMMREMMVGMAGGDCTPEEACRRMMMGLSEAEPIGKPLPGEAAKRSVGKTA